MVGSKYLRAAIRVSAYLWASPYSMLGLALGLAFVAAGARARRVDGTLEVAGGSLGKLVARLPSQFGFCAITLGHVIIGLDEAALAGSRAHERVHVRQYERWGPLFVPAYVAASLWQLMKGRRPYRDNCFEREAYACERATEMPLRDPP